MIQDYFFKQPQILSDFDNHLIIKDNNRILFSGPFGSGKTTFLNYYWEERSKDYVALKIYPVAYAVSSNTDIYELIKYDLVTQLSGLLAEDLNKYAEAVKKAFTLHSFLSNKLDLTQLIKTLILCLPGTESAVNVFDEIKAQMRSYVDYHSEIKEGDSGKSRQYIEHFKSIKGGIYENDPITELIIRFVIALRKKFEKKIVLVIDDLDRLDPEHIFRILNIFSTHYKNDESTHKFDLDKVILVCDYSNLEKIYKHRYGSQVDFAGYIDKYYSIKPFDFNNEDVIGQEINRIFDLKKIISPYNTVKSESLVVNDENLPFRYLKFLLKKLINVKVLNLRTLLSRKSIIVPHHDLQLTFMDSYPAYRLPLFVVLYTLVELIGYDRLLLAFKLLEERFISVNRLDKEHWLTDSMLTSTLVFVAELDYKPGATRTYAKIGREDISIVIESRRSGVPYSNLFLSDLDKRAANLFTYLAAALTKINQKTFLKS